MIRAGMMNTLNLLEQAQDDYWLLMLLTLEKKPMRLQIYWRDNVENIS